MKVRNFSRLEFKYAGLTGLFVILRAFLIYLVIMSVLVLSLSAVGMIWLGNDSMGTDGAVFLGLIVLMTVFAGMIFIYERLIVGAMNLRPIQAFILFLIFFIPLLNATVQTTRGIVQIHDASLFMTAQLALSFCAYLFIFFFVSSQLMVIAKIRSPIERRLLYSHQPSLLTWEGIFVLFGLPRSAVFLQTGIKRIFLLMAVSSIFVSCLPIAAIMVPNMALVYSEFMIASCGPGSPDFGNCLHRDATENIAAALLILPTLLIILLVIGSLLRRFAFRMLINAIDRDAKDDVRQPVFFLRAFEDDQIVLNQTRRSIVAQLLSLGRQVQTLDALLLDEATSVGPVRALGDPSGRVLAVPGARREIRSDETWLHRVEELMDLSKAIVLVLENSDGIWTELDRLIAKDHIHKTLFVMHPRYATGMEYQLILERLLQIARANGRRDFDELTKVMRRKAGNRRFLGFHFAASGGLRVYVSQDYSWISMVLLLRVFFRSAARTVTKRPKAKEAKTIEARRA